MRSHRSARALLLGPILAFAAILVMASPAAAGTQSVRASKIQGGKLVFKLRGVSRSSRVGAARVRIGRYRRRVSLRRVRRAMGRGVLRVRIPRRLRKRLQRKRRRRAALVVTIAPTATPLPGESCSVPSGARYVSPSGSDSNPGTSAQPWRTLDKAEAESTPGLTVVVRGGAYSAQGRTTWLEANGTASAPITWVGEPGETPEIRGAFGIGGNHRRVCGLRLAGPTGPVGPARAGNPEREEVKVYIEGDHVELANSEVTGTRWHAGIYLDGANDVRLVGNHVHDNGRFDDPSHANLDHGIYWGSGSGVVERNRIEHNYAYGVQLYPNATNVTVRDNRISRHGKAGVIISEDASGNQVLSNEIFDNRHGIMAWDLRGSGNAARDNRLWGNTHGNFVDTGGIALSGNQAL